MGITYEIDASIAVVFEYWRGSITIDEVAKFWKLRLADQSTKNYWRILTDVRECQPDFSTEEYRILVKTMLQPALSGRKFKIAVLVKDPIQFGVSRQFQVFFGDVSESAIFTDESAAREWLLQ